jgi:hypothetical protein
MIGVAIFTGDSHAYDPGRYRRWHRHVHLVFDRSCRDAARAIEQSVGGQAGFYLFPRMAPAAGSESGPAGLLVWRPNVARSLNPANLGTEFATELAEALIAAALVSMAALSGFVPRVGLVLLVGLAAAITTNVSYWNWYGFPTAYTLAYSLIEFVGYTLAGIVIALIVPKRAAATAR